MKTRTAVKILKAVRSWSAGGGRRTHNRRQVKEAMRFWWAFDRRSPWRVGCECSRYLHHE